MHSADLREGDDCAGRPVGVLRKDSCAPSCAAPARSGCSRRATATIDHPHAVAAARNQEDTMANAAGGKGQTALISGASAGIGLALAECFAQDGYDLILTARSRGSANGVAAARREVRCHATPIALDLEGSRRRAQARRRDRGAQARGRRPRQQRRATESPVASTGHASRSSSA
jgi:hypothetical protein